MEEAQRSYILTQASGSFLFQEKQSHSVAGILLDTETLTLKGRLCIAWFCPTKQSEIQIYLINYHTHKRKPSQLRNQRYVYIFFLKSETNNWLSKQLETVPIFISFSGR